MQRKNVFCHHRQSLFLMTLIGNCHPEQREGSRCSRSQQERWANPSYFAGIASLGGYNE